MIRPLAGHLKGLYPPLGTVVGPNWLNELLIVSGHDDTGSTLGYASIPEIEEASRHDPRSIAEFRVRVDAQPLPAWLKRGYR